jgi:hypothetical protein
MYFGHMTSHDKNKINDSMIWKKKPIFLYDDVACYFTSY